MPRYDPERDGPPPPLPAEVEAEGAGAVLPAGWETATSRSSGDVYYVNQLTGETQFEFPAAPAIPAQEPEAEPLGADDEGGSSPALPAGWEVATSRSTGDTYYINTLTGDSQFEWPAEAAGARQAPGTGAAYVCQERSVIRTGFEMSSEKAGVLEVGEVIEALEERLNEQTGTVRVRFDRGWTSQVSSGGVQVLAVQEDVTVDMADPGHATLQPDTWGVEEPSGELQPEPEPEQQGADSSSPRAEAAITPEASSEDMAALAQQQQQKRKGRFGFGALRRATTSHAARATHVARGASAAAVDASAHLAQNVDVAAMSASARDMVGHSLEQSKRVMAAAGIISDEEKLRLEREQAESMAEHVAQLMEKCVTLQEQLTLCQGELTAAREKEQKRIEAIGDKPLPPTGDTRVDELQQAATAARAAQVLAEGKVAEAAQQVRLLKQQHAVETNMLTEALTARQQEREMARDGMEQAHQDLKKAKAELAAHAQTIAEQAARIKTLEVGGAEQIAATQSQVEVANGLLRELHSEQAENDKLREEATRAAAEQKEEAERALQKALVEQATKQQVQSAKLKAEVAELTCALETEQLARKSSEALCEKLFNEMASVTQ